MVKDYSRQPRKAAEAERLKVTARSGSIRMWTMNHEPYQHGEVFVTDDGAETAWTWAL